MISRIQRAALRRISKRKLLAAIICILFTAAIGTMAAQADRDVLVFVDGECRSISIFGNDPTSVLTELGLPDSTPFDWEETENGTEMHVGELHTVTVLADGKESKLSVRCCRVAYVLQKLQLTVGRYDMVTPSESSILDADGTVTLTRVTFTLETVTESVKPETVYIDCPDIPRGAEVEKFAGVSGYSEITYQVKLVDGVPTQREAVIVAADRLPENRVVLRGTGRCDKSAPLVTTSAAVNARTVSKMCPETPIAVDEKGVPLNYKRCVTGKATAYTARKGAHTATGDLAGVGYVAVNPREIPYGSMLYIRTKDGKYIYGYAKASDTGGFAKTKTIKADLYFNSRSQCFQFGVRDVEIYVL